MSRLAKAVVHRVDPSGRNRGRGLPVQFNPSELTLAKANQIAEVPVPGLDSPILQFVRGQSEVLTVELFFDTTDSGTGADAKPVTALTDEFYDLVKIEPATHAPPVLRFAWGATHFPGKNREAFTCVLDSVRQRYTLFSPEGVPLRAVLSLQLREYKTLAGQLEELGLQSPDHTKAHVARDGETLAQIAYAEYGDPAAWRLVADANHLDDPLAVEPGTVLTVPRAVR